MFYLIITTKNIELKMHKIKDYIFINIIYYTDFTILSMFSCYFIIGKTQFTKIIEIKNFNQTIFISILLINIFIDRYADIIKLIWSKHLLS